MTRLNSATFTYLNFQTIRLDNFAQLPTYADRKMDERVDDYLYNYERI